MRIMDGSVWIKYHGLFCKSISPIKRMIRSCLPITILTLSLCLLLWFITQGGLIFNRRLHYPSWRSSDQMPHLQNKHLIIKVLCEAHNQSRHLCCSSASVVNHTVQSWFQCIRGRDLYTTNDTGLNILEDSYHKWAKYHPPQYKMSEHYYLPASHDHAMDSLKRITCSVAEGMRNITYHMLRYWTDFARIHNIVWWITYGTLLGSVRDQDFIPYDHDIDIAVLDVYEPVLNSLAVQRTKINHEKIQLVTRQRHFCPFDHGIRLDCNGKLVNAQLDRCSICTPLGRLITGKKGYVDLFITRFVNREQRQTTVRQHGIRGTTNDQSNRDTYDNADDDGDEDTNQNLISLLDASVDVDKGRIFSYSLKTIFPLSTCLFMGLHLPCPRDPLVVLKNTYGANFMKPVKLCNTTTGRWVTSRR
ncbi:hypothetical protein D915_005636 [Fasciola hepatica]|uniref:LicD/FKTN/FKRP nucleotidyltransferase domain-containing protein n=1 Tax=Fasciola hepatica TaxID=6192 RepID=A0A4E0RYC2_FASHE|nr:hypothetical protein D915_005636 [Fasciola hepatica]